MADALAAFVAEVGSADAGPVVGLGGGTHWQIGGRPDPSARAVRAPAGVVAYEPTEMTVRVGAGTTVADLDAALAPHGQCVALPDAPGSTIGGTLAVGRSGLRRLGWGPVRDAVLELRCASAGGDLIVCGGPTVKNVSGYDLPRLLVGSLGTVALIGEVVLRTRPAPACEQWFAVQGANPFALHATLARPASILWDGTTTWVLLDGHPDDVTSEAARCGLRGGEVESPPVLPAQRWSLRPGDLASLPDDGLGPFVAEIGVGIVHRDVPQDRAPLSPAVVALHERIKVAFDPTGRLAPGRTVGQR